MAEGALHKEPIQPWSPRVEGEEAQCPGQCSTPSRCWLSSPWCSHTSALSADGWWNPAPGRSFSPLWLGVWQIVGISPGLAPKPGLKLCQDCQLPGFTARAALSAGWCLAWWALGDFTSWDLHLCACWEAWMGHKPITHEYWSIGSLP